MRTTATKSTARKTRFLHVPSTGKALTTYECSNAYNRVVVPASSAHEARRTVEANPIYGAFFRTLKSTYRKLR